MSTRNWPGLRTISASVIAILIGLAVAVAVALVLLTSRLQHASTSLEEAVASIKLSEEAEVDLLVHARGGEPIMRGHVESRLRRKLLDIARHVSTPREQEALDTANQALDRYLRASRGAVDEPTLRDAHEAFRVLVELNLAQAELLRRDMERWDDLGDIIGGSVGVLMVLVLGGLFWWLRRAVVRPILDLSHTIERFRGGDGATRATEAGALELREMAQQFNAMCDALERQQAQRLVYLGGVAHDLRNPLGALRLWTDAIDPVGPLPPDDRVRRMLAVIQRQVTRLDRMVADLLEASQIEAGQLALRPEAIDLREVVRDVAALFDGTSTKHELVLQLPDAPLVVRGDAGRLGQTLTNLVSNAIKYSPRGGTVRIAATEEDGDVVVRVTDSGVGMTAEDLARLWEPFQRGATVDGTIPGAGLGLSIAKRIVDAHGGALVATSEVGVGTTFTLRLRALAPAPRKPAPAPAQPIARA